MQQHPIQVSNSNNNANESPNFIYFTAAALKLILVIFISTYVGLNNAEPTHTPKENKSSAAPEKKPANTQPTQDWVKGRLLVTPRAGLSTKELEKALKQYGAKPERQLKQLNVHIYELPAGVDEVKVKRALNKERRFKHVELDMKVAHDLSISDPSFSNSWALPKIQAPTAWDTSNGDGVIIAILDTGVDGTHPDLAANMVPGWNMYDNNADTTDIGGHGTWVAGTAAAAANNGSGSAGVAWAAGIMPIRIADPDGFGYFSTIAAGIRWAADNGAKVVNNSYGGVAGSSTIRSAAEYLRSKGGVVVVSAGNTGTLLNHEPSDSLLVASATASNDVRPSWSSYGPYVDIAAPGVSIYTTSRGGGYSNVSGTSFSSPIVAATAALMLSANHDLTPVDVSQILMSTAVDIGATGFDDFYGAGRVDAAKAVEAARLMISVDNQAPTITIKSPTGGELAGTIFVDVNYSDNVGVVRTELFVNDQKVITDNLPPFAFAWDSTSLPDGDHTLTAYAFDAAGNQANSQNVLVSISNNTTTTDTEAPVITSFNLTDGMKVSRKQTVSVSATDDQNVAQIKLIINGDQVATSTGNSLNYSWKTRTRGGARHTAHTVTTQVTDDAGNMTSKTVTVQT